MRIRDIFENFNDELKENIVDVAMMFLNNGIKNTSVENFVLELSKRGFNATIEDIKFIIGEMDSYSINGENIILDSEDDSDIDMPDDLSNEREYNPAVSKAKQAIKKRT